MLRKKSLLLTLLLHLFLTMLFGEGVLSHPRKVYVIQVEHFDILFPQESAETAKVLADNADSLYEKAKAKIGAKYDFRIPVVISPDSDELYVSYTSMPYNRILIMDGVPSPEQAFSEDALLSYFYKELCFAILSSIRSPLHQFISTTIGGSTYQPVALINLPFTFIEGRCVLEQKDKVDLQALIQAKAENEFPSYYQACVKYDIYPGNELLIAACSAFSAYLIQAYGYEKYCELWTECGTIHPFLMEGIFYKVYGKLLNVLWNDFKDSIPLAEYNFQYSDSIYTYFDTDTEGLYSNLLVTDYGIVWYDAMRHEVDILDKNGQLYMRQLLFLANDIDSMSLSPDGRYVVVSYTQIRTEDVFKKEVSWIYDLKERTFLNDVEYNLRNGAIVQFDDKAVMAGVSVEDKCAALQVWDITEDTDDSVKLFEKQFEKNQIPYSIMNAGNNVILYVLLDKGIQYICKLDLSSGEEKRWQVSINENKLETLKISELKPALKNKNGKKTPVYSFEYKIDQKNCSSRIGYFTVDEMYNLTDVFLQKEEISGGVYYPSLINGNVYYVSKYHSYNLMNRISEEYLTFTKGNVSLLEGFQTEPSREEIHFDKNSLNEYSLSRYLPLKYMLPLSVVPLFPIKEISIEKGIQKWPGLGFTLNSHSDPFMNNKFSISAGWNFLNLSFTKLFNVSDRVVNEELHDEAVNKKDKSLAFYFENTSTPVDIKVGSLFKFNLNGEYDLKATAGTNWIIPLGMVFSNLNFAVETDYSISTDYYDPDYVNINPSLNNWPRFEDAYSVGAFSVSAQYTNIHQYGRTPYEKRGFSVGARLYSIWDLYEINLLNEKRDLVLKELAEKGEQNELTQAQVQEMYNENLLSISQLNLGIIANIEIPRLTPLHIVNGWVLSVPTSIHAEILNSTGTAMETRAECLLIGKEIHDGFPFLQLYFSRIGLIAGYDLRLIYDTAQVVRPDIRRIDSMSSILGQTTVDDNVYLILNMDFTSPIGAMSSTIFSTRFKMSYYPETKGFIFNFSLIANF